MKKNYFAFLLIGSILFSSCGKKEPSKDETKIVEIYASNDFHGAVIEEGYSLGLAKFGQFFKEKGEEENTLLLDQGDTWQGSIYSNYNHGKLINDVMSYARFDARTVGNHDFDWGTGIIKINTAREYDGYKIPVLAANVYDYDFMNKKMGNIQQSDIGVKSVTYTLENNLKVGIVGVIGENQITSICSTYVQNIGFKNHVEVIKEEARKLKDDKCDVIIASCHAGQEDLLGNNLKDYVDLVLCAHTHKRETENEDGLMYAQFGSSGQYFGHISLTYSTKKKDVINTNIETISARTISRNVKDVDPAITNLINEYNSECDLAGNVNVASIVSGDFNRYEHAPNLMCRAIYDEAVKEGYDDLILSYTNESRANLYDGKWEYKDIYKAFPFDNEVYIIEITGYELRREIINYNNVYKAPNYDGTYSLNKKYKIACIDFLAFHTNKDREYDFFSQNNGNYIGVLEKNYREILRDWLIENDYDKEKILYSRDFSNSSPSHIKNFVQV